MDRRLLIRFYHATVESVLTYCITVWYAGCSAADKRRLQGVVRTAEKIIGCQLPSWRMLPLHAILVGHKTSYETAPIPVMSV